MVRGVGPECGRDEVDVDVFADACGGILVGQGLRAWSPIGWRGTVRGASCWSDEVRAARWVGCSGHTFVTPQSGVSMKPLVTASESSFM